VRVAIAVAVRNSGSGGFFKHLAELLKYYKNNRPDLQITVFAPTNLLDKSFEVDYRCCFVRADDHKHAFAELVEALNNSDCDVVLNILPRPLKGLQRPLVTIVQNIEPLQKLTYSVSLWWRVRLLALRFEQWRACQASSVVVAVSETLKEAIIKYLGVDPEKIAVVYHGVDLYLPSTSDYSVKSFGGLKGDFIFSAGSIVPYRGYEDLILAMADIKRRASHVPQLVIAGAEDPASRRYYQRLLRISAALGIADNVLWVGALSKASMTWCYANCCAFIQCSRAEACPNIVLESMQHGCLSISCDQQPMPEIYGGSAIYYKTGKFDQLALLIERVQSGDLSRSSVLRAEYTAASVLRAREFSWAKTGEETLKLLEKASAMNNHKI
jgi:glycosyltransferase involved in cell wall biosynthesis